MTVGKKKEAGSTANRPSKQHVKGENFYHKADKVKRLNMYKNNKAQRDRSGKIVQAAPYQSKTAPVGRVAPDRRWFNNTRVISQDTLAAFREAVAQKADDPHTFLLRRNKLPLSLITAKDHDETAAAAAGAGRARDRVHAPDFGSAFGPKSKRNRVSLGASTFEEMGEKLSTNASAEMSLKVEGDEDMEEDEEMVDAGKDITRDSVFTKGQSHRIWSELHKVIDASDVLLMVLDARDPEGTRCEAIEKHIAKDAPHKHLIFILNKCDLVPVKVTTAWVRHLCKTRPTLAFRANMKNPFGKGSLISLLRQFQILHKDRKTITAGVVGYPNTGKSSLLNTLRNKSVCKTAPVPGETKYWQYISFTERILLLDAPGVVPRQTGLDPSKILLRGAVRVENISSPSGYIDAVLEKCEPRHVARTYGVEPTRSEEGWEVTDFLAALGRKWGRLLKGGEPDVDAVARQVIRDFLRGNLPWYSVPPRIAAEDGNTEAGTMADEQEDDGEDEAWVGIEDD